MTILLFYFSDGTAKGDDKLSSNFDYRTVSDVLEFKHGETKKPITIDVIKKPQVRWSIRLIDQDNKSDVLLYCWMLTKHSIVLGIVHI